MPETSTLTHSKSIDNFLKAVFVLQQKMERVSTNALAEGLSISAPSVTDMAQRLVEAGLVDYQKYRGVILTEDGRILALKLLRRHRLIETYLVEELGYALQDVHDEAETLEHAVSDRFIEAIASKLGHPHFDPHGDPIPDADGMMVRREMEPLSELATEQTATVARLIAKDPDMLQHMLERGFALGALVQVQDRDPFEGPLTVAVDGEERVIGFTVAENILVEIDPNDDETS